MHEKSYNFNKLAPRTIERDETYIVYKEALDLAFIDSEIRNIAITGIYGAGKSSFWKTYQKEKEELSLNDWKNDKVITIALSDFEDVLGGKSEGIGKHEANDISSVERQIINQVLYQVDSKKIPLSKYDIKLPKTKTEMNKEISLISLLVVGIFLLLLKTEITQVYFPTESFVEAEMIIMFIGSLIVGVPIIIILQWLLTKTRVKLTKVNIKGAEAIVKEDEDKNVFNHNIRELVYIIVASEVKTIVFEDLDRFENVELFTKLRDLNYLVNSKSKHVVKSVYMIRDDLFATKDRTKFFDYILPIVPVINSQNSKGKMLEFFSDIKKPLLKPTNQLIERISIYIDDMRLLYAVRNEYWIYSNAIDLINRKLQADKLLSLIVLKNIFPLEFDLLQQDKGYIYNLLSKINNERKIKLQKIDEDILMKRGKIAVLEELIVSRKTDLMALYLPTNFRLNAEGKPWKVVLLEWSKNPGKSYSTNHGSYSSSLDFEGLIKILSRDKDYIQQAKLLEDGLKDDQIRNLKDEIKNLTRNREKISVMSIPMILKEKSIDELDVFFSDTELAESVISDHYFPLIRFLLIDGWIDETYWYYKGNFYQSTMGRNDEIFMRRLFDGTADDERFHLDNPSVIASKLSTLDYERMGTFNFELMIELINNRSKDTIWRIVRNVINSEKAETILTFLDGLDCAQLEKFVLIMVEEHYDLLWGIFTNSKQLDELNYKMAVVLYSNFDSLPCDINQLNNFTAKKSTILEKDYAQFNDSLLMGLHAAKVSFIDISNIFISKEMIIKLEGLALFELTINNIRKAVDTIIGGDSNNNLSRLFNYIFQKEDIKVTKDRVVKNLESMINEYTDLLSTEGQKAETGEITLLYILNSNITLETKKLLINVESTRLSTLHSIEETVLWNLIIEQNLLECNEMNVDKYYENFQLTDTLIKYLNACYKITTEIGLPVELADKLVNSSEISDIGFDDSLRQSLEVIEMLNNRLSADKIEKLIDNKRLALTTFNFEHIISLDSTKVFYKYIFAHKDRFVSFAIDNSLMHKLDEEDIINIINQDILESSNTEMLIIASEKKISLFAVNSDCHEIRFFILNNAFKTEDIDKIMQLQDKFDLWVDFLKLLDSNIDVYKDTKSYEWNFDYIDKVLESEVVGVERKVYLIIEVIRRRELISNVPRWISNILDIKEIADVFYNKRPKIRGDYQRKIAIALDEIGVISIADNGSIYFKKNQFNKLI